MENTPQLGPRAFLAAFGLALLSTLIYQPSTSLAQGTAFTYQGRLSDGGSPANGLYDFQFTLYDSATAGNAVSGTVGAFSGAVSNGLFTVIVDFGAGMFTSANRWLEIAVRQPIPFQHPPFQTLTPRQPLTPTPYAIEAGNVTGVIPGGSLSGSYPGAVTLSNSANVLAGNGTGLTSLNADQLASGTVPAAALGNAWKTGGNAGTTAGVNFLGTTDTQALELKAGGMRVWRMEPDPRTGALSGNLIGGFVNNFIEQPGSGGDFIGSGGYPAGPNVIHSNSSGVFIGAGSANQAGPNLNDAVVGGGFGNSVGGYGSQAVIAGGNVNTNNGSVSAIGGGRANLIGLQADGSTIGGGVANQIVGSQLNSVLSTIGGGWLNNIYTNGVLCAIGGGFQNNIQAGAQGGTIGGGYGNSVSNLSSTVPGGSANQALGNLSFAAGHRAQAIHDGAFVWADSQNADFASTGINQFLVRAVGGVRFVTGGTGMTLDGVAVATANQLTGVALRAGGNAFTGLQSLTGADGLQLLLQNSADSRFWAIYDENFGGSGALIFQPSSGVGAYIRRSDGNYVVNSDGRMKEGITALGSVLERVLQLRPVSYRFRTAPQDAPRSLGLIAQEVEPLFPEVVSQHNDMKGLAYSELVPVTIGAIQELNWKAEAQRAELNQKQTEIEELRQRLERLEKFLDAKPNGSAR